MPKISFIVPVYKVEKYLSQCIESIINQTFKDFELILIDDGSPDKCPEICDKYANTDKRIRVIHKQNEGVSAARNDGIETANGEWAYFVDSDDWIERNAAEMLINDAMQYDVDCVMSDCIKHFDNGKQKRVYEFSQPFFTDDRKTIEAIQKFVLCRKYSPYYMPNVSSGYAAPWGKFVRLKLLTNNGIRFDTKAKGVFDDGVYSLYLLNSVKRFYYNRKHTYNYRIVGSSLTHAYKPDAMEILKENYALVDEFINKTSKDASFIQAEQCRRIHYFTSYLSNFYFNPNNPNTIEVIKQSLLHDLEEWPYKEAFTSAKYRNLELKHKYILFAGKRKSFWMMKLYPDIKRMLRRKE